ncbi:serine-rich adhesin for platelets-like [Biomphalaria glabrata]|uniref:Serine-rich adhesin for platelets-like n=1 Tax=Biomphalaria glabrata TaxID=6526 RepID=A0A9W3BI47_BIOGL|nr:serine-rich adhesin for platelets-like [Biomphalaria glabrata]
MSSTLLLVGLFCVCRHAALTYANMYSYKSSNNIDHIWAYTQLNYSVYVPTCGWKLILQSGMVITNMTGGDEFFTYTKVDDYTYLLNSKVKYADLSISRPNDQDITLIGPFGTKDPVIIVDWFCVCNQSTHGDCQIVSDAKLSRDPYSSVQDSVSSSTASSGDGQTTTSSTLAELPSLGLTTILEYLSSFSPEATSSSFKDHYTIPDSPTPSSMLYLSSKTGTTFKATDVSSALDASVNVILDSSAASALKLTTSLSPPLDLSTAKLINLASTLEPSTTYAASATTPSTVAIVQASLSTLATSFVSSTEATSLKIAFSTSFTISFANSSTTAAHTSTLPSLSTSSDTINTSEITNVTPTSGSSSANCMTTSVLQYTSSVYQTMVSMPTPQQASGVNQASSTLTDFNLHLTKAPDLCHVNDTRTLSEARPHLFDCSFLCRDDLACLGINLWEAGGHCDLVFNVSSGDGKPRGGFYFLPGCQFYFLHRT